MPGNGKRSHWRLGFVLLALVSAALLGIVAALVLKPLYWQQQATQRELTGAQCILHLQDVAILVQQMRGLRLIRNQVPDAAIDARLLELSAQLLDAVGHLETRDYRGLTCLRLDQAAMLRHFSRRQVVPDGERVAVADEADQLVRELQGRMQDAAYVSTLGQDWEPGSYFLANLLALRLPGLIEAVGRLRSQAAALVAVQHWSDEDSRQMTGRREGVRIALDLVETELRAYATVLPTLAKHQDDGRDEVRRALADFLVVTGRIERNGPSGVEALALFDQGSQALGSIRLLHGQVAQELDALLRTRQASLRQRILLAWLATLGLLVALLILHLRFDRRERRLLKKLEDLATTDTLTHVGNRARFEEDFVRHLIEAVRYGRPLSVIMLDIDHFKQINDRHGHAVGDQVLRAVATIVGAEVRSADALYRWGGEEFCVLSPETVLAGARESAERIRNAVAGADFGTVAGVTISLGVAQWRDGEEADALLRRVDAALYAAKQQGRNRVETAEALELADASQSSRLSS